MKTKQKLQKVFKIITIIGILFFMPQQIEAQFLKKLKEKAQKKIEREAEKRAERRINKKIDKTFDDAEDTIDGKNKKDTKKTSNQEKKSNNNNKETTELVKPNVSWSRFDFIPGETVIFEDGPNSNEENGEFPSRWDLFEGGAEIMNVNGEPAIAFITDSGNMYRKGIVPYLKNSKEDYLPEIFTIEFDGYFNPEKYNEKFHITLHDRKNQKRTNNPQISFGINEAEFGTSRGVLEGKRGNIDSKGGWKHMSIAYTKGKLKIYLEDQRLVNIPHLEGNPTGITLTATHGNMFVKNIRIAKGGVKYYDRVISEGKIIVNGIKFDVNKATLKPESMGPINEIYKLMKENPTVNFSVEGHTDSDGSDTNNQALSEDRGKTVMNKLIEMGIDSNRLKSTGFGESKPIDNNNTPESKANNRRVEFVKFSGSASTNNNTNNKDISNSSAFYKLDKKTIAAKLEMLPESFKIPISNNSGIINGQGTVIIYATSDGLMGKMEILDIDTSNNYELSIKYVTYNYNGSIHSQSNHLKIKSTYTCDLDKGKSENVEQYERDFFFKREDNKTSSILQSETSILKIYK